MNERIELRYKIVPFDQLTRFEKMHVGICCPENLRYEILNMHGELYINSENPHCQEITEMIKQFESVQELDTEGKEILGKICEYTHKEAANEVFNLWVHKMDEMRKQQARKAAAAWYKTNSERLADSGAEFNLYHNNELLFGIFEEVRDQLKKYQDSSRDNYPTIKALKAVFLAGFDAGQESRM